jgi:acyl-CoA synthetase (NDP forming)/RimJ/RimL family protein N-acetyltransferase
MTAADVLLADGSLGVIRTLAPGDAAALHELHDRASDESVRLRFFSLARRAAHTYVDHVLESPGTLALAAEVHGRMVGLATAEPIDDRSSEVAFLVDDELRGQGLGTLLLEHLAALASDQGVRRFEAEVLAENNRMLKVFEDAGFRVERRLDTGVQVLEVDTSVTAAVQDAADLREFRSEAHSLTPMLAPRSVAVYGVRHDGTGIGATVLRAIRDGGYRGELIAIHPSAVEVGGVPALRSLTDHAGPVDLAVIAVPARHAEAALADAGDAEVRAAVVISSGFGEMGEAGAEMQQGLAGLARRLGMRVVGPNCLGLVCNDPDVRLNATFNGSVPPPGGLAVASQSGGVGIVLMDLAGRTGLGVRYFVSLGNKADVSSNDLLAAWYDDPEVTCAALYLESFGNARKFARFARRFSERKPLLAVVGGRSSGGKRAGASHTAAAASSDVAVRALFAQAGVIGCTDADELVDTARLLTGQSLPRGRRVAVVSNAGGLGVLAADAAADNRLDVVEFSPSLQTALGTLVNQTTGTANPVDAGAGAQPSQLAAIVDTVLKADEVDATVVLLVATGDNDIPTTVRALAEVGERHPSIPMTLVPLGGPEPDCTGVTTYRSAAAAVGSLSRAAAYAEWRRAEPKVAEPVDPSSAGVARAVAQRLLDAPTSDGWVAPAAAAALLEPYRIELAGRIVRGADAAENAAAELGFPVAVKVADAKVVHRTEQRLVRTGLRRAPEVGRAVAEFETNLDGPVDVLVQPMVTGVEIAVGVIRDRSLGPLIMVAAGGVAVDVWDDHAFLLPPLGTADVVRAFRSLRVWPLLDGFRGAEPAAVDDLARLVVDVAQLAVDVPELAELDLNPVIVNSTGCAVVDAKVRLVSPDEALRDLPRQLRHVG